ncbi:TPA: tetraacyldisaccharide 4'-kinase, partial [Candidatus Poribacteria bacterium]|nr:tetraacyldisaccharide 4'-kinase [Candidatus Poribacteria bacterium]
MYSRYFILRIYAILTGESVSVISSVVRIILMPLSWVYGLIVVARNYLYDREILASLDLACGIISVGNIVTGGTGKTPIVIWLAKHFWNSGYRVAIILRGYKRQA